MESLARHPTDRRWSSRVGPSHVRSDSPPRHTGQRFLAASSDFSRTPRAFRSAIGDVSHEPQKTPDPIAATPSTSRCRKTKFVAARAGLPWRYVNHLDQRNARQVAVRIPRILTLEYG